MSSFPDGFLIGASSSAYQTEGAYQEDGKGWNIWDHQVNVIHSEMENANIACDSYHKYKEDVKLLKEAGFKHYRFSISWARILPHGDWTKNGINQDGINHYKAFIKELKDNDIEPVVTIYHWDLPHYLQKDYGGWTSSLVIDYLEDYADVLFKNFGDSVKYWITINEPTLILYGYENGVVSKMAPGKSIPSPGNYIVVHHMLLAHARIFRLYDQKYRTQQKGQVGISLVATCYRPKNVDNKDDVTATNLANEFFLGLFAHPIFTKEGDYPPIVRKIVDENSLVKEGRQRSRLFSFTEEEKKSLIGSADFFGVNHYMTQLCSLLEPGAELMDLAPVYYHHLKDDPMKFFREDLNLNIESLQDPHPSGFREILNYIKDNYGNPKVFVTENGFGVNGTETSLDDVDRVNFFRDFLEELHNAIYKDNCNVKAYTIWSLLDNFEWGRGYQWKYGVVNVNFDDPGRKRSPKRSHGFFKELLKTGVIPKKL